MYLYKVQNTSEVYNALLRMQYKYYKYESWYYESKTGGKEFITCWGTVSKFACQKAQVKVQLEIKIAS